MGLVEKQKALLRPVPEVLEKGVAMLGAPERLIRNDEPRVGGPGVDSEAPLLPAAGDERAVIDLEAQAEPPLHLGAPLEAEGRGTDDEGEVHALAKHQLLEHEPGLDGLSQADVVGDEQVRPR